MELFDSHAHYDDEKFNEDRDEIIEKIYSSGVTKFMCAGYNLESSLNGIKLADKYDYIYTTSGISPNDVNSTIEETKKDIVQLRKNIIDYKDRHKKENIIDKIVGIGEIGLDYYWNAENKDIPKEFFKPIEKGLDTETVIADEFAEILTLIRGNGIRTRSIKYEYDPKDDNFVKNVADKYNVAKLNVEMIGTYKDFEGFLKELYKHEHFLDISSVEIVPYQKDRKILIIKFQLKLYAQK